MTADESRFVKDAFAALADLFGKPLDAGPVSRMPSDLAKAITPKAVIWHVAKDGDMNMLRQVPQARRWDFLTDAATYISGEMLSKEPSLYDLSSWLLLTTRVLESIRMDREQKDEHGFPF